MFKIFNNSLKPQLEKLKIDFKLFESLNQSIPILLGIFIFFNPIPHTTSIKEICFFLSVFIVLVLLLFKKTKFSLKTPLLLPLGLFVGWAFLSIFFAVNKENSIHDFFSHLLKYIVLYYILINFFNSRKRLVALSWTIIISVSIFSIGGLFYYYFILGNSLATRYAVGLFPEVPINFIGIVTVFAIILSLYHIFKDINLYQKAVLIICLLPLFAATVLTQSRGTLIALTLATIVQLFPRNKRTVVVFLVGMLFVVAVSPIKNRFTFNSIFHNERISINYITNKVIKDYPITGIGFGMLTFVNDIDVVAYSKGVPDKLYTKYIHTPHNMFLSIAVRVGLVGLALFLYIVFVFGKMCWQCIKYGKDDFIRNWGHCSVSAFVAFFVIGIFEPVFLFHVTSIVFYVICSMITILWHLNDGGKSSK